MTQMKSPLSLRTICVNLRVIRGLRTVALKKITAHTTPEELWAGRPNQSRHVARQVITTTKYAKHTKSNLRIPVFFSVFGVFRGSVRRLAETKKPFDQPIEGLC